MQTTTMCGKLDPKAPLAMAARAAAETARVASWAAPGGREHDEHPTATHADAASAHLAAADAYLAKARAVRAAGFAPRADVLAAATHQRAAEAHMALHA